MNDPSSYHKSAHTRKLVDELKGEFDSLPYGRVKWEKLLKFQGSSDEEEVNELGENKKLVLKNALEKECLSARTELFRPAWRPPR